MEANELQGEVLPIESQEIALPDANAEEITEAVESESSTEQETETEQPKPKGVQKRLDELTRNWREEQRRAEQLQQMLERALAQKAEPQPPAQPQQIEPTEPKLEQFQTYEEYVAALADYKADQKIKAWEQSVQQREQQKLQAERQASFEARIKNAEAEMPDFRDVALNPRLPVSDTMAEAIREMEEGPRVLYALGQNPAEAARIASLPPTVAAVELGKFAVKALMPQPKTVTSAPPPVNPLSGGIGTRNADPDKMTDNEWAEWRRQQLKR